MSTPIIGIGMGGHFETMTAPPQSIPPKIRARPAPAGLFIAAALGLAVLGGCAVVFFFNPSTHGFYPVCVFHELTGLNCPGCGGTRSLYALLHGHLELAMKDNALFVLLTPAAALRYTWLAGRKMAGRPAGSFFTPAILWGLLVVAVVFAVARNLPWFSFLSP